MSDGTKADKIKKREEKLNARNQIMKYDKYAKRQFYWLNKKKIKNTKKINSSLSTQDITNQLWNALSDIEKNDWFNSHCEHTK